MFLHHESCPRCGSKDNLARYLDGSAWCFGCHYRERSTSAPSSFLRGTGEVVPHGEQENPRIPDDCGTSFSPTAVEWLGQYHLDIPTAISRGVVYSASRDQIIYQLGNVWQARNLREGGSDGNSKRKRSKNFTSGEVNDCLHIYSVSVGEGESISRRSLAVVEDPVSAIRVAEACRSDENWHGSDSMPLLGSHLATSRLNALAGLYRAVVVWLDSDKLKEARDIAGRFKLVGVDAKVIWTPLDPKCYTDKEIGEILT